MSFEDNPADEDREAYDNGLMVEEIKSLQATIAAQAAEIERLTKLSGLWEKMAKHRAARMDTLRSMIRNRDAELAALRSQLDEQDCWLMLAGRNGVMVDYFDDEWHVGSDFDETCCPKFSATGKTLFEALDALSDAANWLTPHAEKGAEV